MGKDKATVDFREFEAAMDKAYQELDRIIDEDRASGTITGLSYIRLEHRFHNGSFQIIAWNDGFSGGPPSKELIGYVWLPIGKAFPVYLINEDTGIVTGVEALGPVFDLFERAAKRGEVEA